MSRPDSGFATTPTIASPKATHLLALLCAPIRETGIGAAAPQDCRSLRVDLYDAGAAVDGDDLSVA
jgi:hypothetical protein